MANQPQSRYRNPILKGTVVAAWLVGALALGRLADQYISGAPSRAPGPAQRTGTIMKGMAYQQSSSPMQQPSTDTAGGILAVSIFMGAFAAAAVLITALAGLSLRSAHIVPGALAPAHVSSSPIVAVQVTQHVHHIGRKLETESHATAEALRSGLVQAAPRVIGVVAAAAALSTVAAVALGDEELASRIQEEQGRALAQTRASLAGLGAGLRRLDEDSQKARQRKELREFLLFMGPR
mmetsp:Transcript_43257/g.109670  ORF Transcript_43257/g.109670 Transcript_43257/m.109670 type:complete len:237 (-) Transcript_43257:35-745(-)